MKGIKDLNVSKASQENDIPTKAIKENADIFANFIYQSFNSMIYVCIFPASLKYHTRLLKGAKTFKGKIIDL